MRTWKNTVTGIRALINKFEPGADSSAENVRAIHAILVTKRYFEDFPALDDMADFEDTGDAQEDMDEANSYIAELYDFADAESIWID